MELTEEQRKIIEETITNKDGDYAISAVAGSGKSFTIFRAIDYIKEHEPNAKILYLVFNKANQLDADAKLRKYSSWLQPVQVSTAHSFAYRKWQNAFGPFNACSNLDWSITRRVLEKDYKYDPEILWSKRKTFDWLLEKYCASKLGLESFLEEMELHFDDDYEGPDKAIDHTILDSKNRTKHVFGIPVSAYACVLKKHLHAFEKIYNQHIDEKTFTHGMYLKHAAYSKKTGGSEFDYVFFDEAQDSNFFMLKLLEKQTLHKVYYVGDERQCIYKFGGSNENVFQTHQFTKMYTLSKSFRFGQKIANLANEVIHMHTRQMVYGTEQIHETNNKTKCLLYRTNAKLYSDALGLAYKSELDGNNIKIDFMKRVDQDLSGIEELLSFLSIYYKSMDYSYWHQNRHIFPQKVYPTLADLEKLTDVYGFKSAYNQLYDYLSDDIHAMYIFAENETCFIEKYNALNKCINRTNPSKIIIMITMHRSKGLEWDNVILAEPTRLYYTDKDGVIRRSPDFMQELNLAYVAITRARKNLDASILFEELVREDNKFLEVSLQINEQEKEIETNEYCEIA